MKEATLQNGSTLKLVEINRIPEIYDDQYCPDCGLRYGIDPGDCACPVEFEIWE